MNSSITQEQANAIAEQFGVELMINNNHGNEKPFQDDGNLHIPAGEISFCFDIGQEMPRNAFNRKVKQILAALWLPVNSEALA